jgi:hypothetical protein
MFTNAVVIRERVILRKSGRLGNVAGLVMLYVSCRESSAKKGPFLV